jgi:hypothetical protein
VSRWRQQAALLAATLEKSDADYFREPPVQFTYAALLRHRGQYQQADEIYRRFVNDSDAVWQRAARGEMWVIGSPTESPKPVLRCYRVSAPPVLDGLLSDDCWQNAMDVKLEPDDGRDTSAADHFIETRGIDESPGRGSLRVDAADMRALAMLAYDQQYLYFAASLPRSPKQPGDPPNYPGRTHDADLSAHDQISLLLDIDRDYATFYRFDVDSRAQTREACWIDQKWDPQWHVACDADSQRWTVEAAIPLEALTPAPPSPGQTWAAGFVRTLPGEGVQSWTHPTGAVPRPATFGLVRFD